MPVLLALLIVIVLSSFVIRLLTDIPYLTAGTVPDTDDFENRYITHPWLAYLHMVPAVVYLLGAPVQLSRRIRTQHYTLHRRLGRVVLSAGVLAASSR